MRKYLVFLLIFLSASLVFGYEGDSLGNHKAKRNLGLDGHRLLFDANGTAYVVYDGTAYVIKFSSSIGLPDGTVLTSTAVFCAGNGFVNPATEQLQMVGYAIITSSDITWGTGEGIYSITDDYIVFEGRGGSDNTDVRWNLDGIRPVLDSPTDNRIEIAEILHVTNIEAGSLRGSGVEVINISTGKCKITPKATADFTLVFDADSLGYIGDDDVNITTMTATLWDGGQYTDIKFKNIEAVGTVTTGSTIKIGNGYVGGAQLTGFIHFDESNNQIIVRPVNNNLYRSTFTPTGGLSLAGDLTATNQILANYIIANSSIGTSGNLEVKGYIFVDDVLNAKNGIEVTNNDLTLTGVNLQMAGQDLTIGATGKVICDRFENSQTDLCMYLDPLTKGVTFYEDIEVLGDVKIIGDNLDLGSANLDYVNYRVEVDTDYYSKSGAIILDTVGASQNSPSLYFRADDGGVEEEAEMHVVQGADPYLRISVDDDNSSPVLTGVLDIHDTVLALSTDNTVDIGAAADNRPKDYHGAGNIVIAGTINTGQGATEVYAMNQALQTTNDVTHKNITATYGVIGATLNITGRGDFDGDVHADAFYDASGVVTDGNLNAEENLEAEQFTTAGYTNASIYLHQEEITYAGATSTASLFTIKLPDSTDPNFAFTSMNWSRQWDDSTVNIYVTFVTSSTSEENAFLEVGISTCPFISGSWEIYESTTAVGSGWCDKRVATMTITSTNVLEDGKHISVHCGREDVDSCANTVYVLNVKFAYTKD